MTKKRIIIRVISILLSVILSFALGASIVSLTVLSVGRAYLTSAEFNSTIDNTDLGSMKFIHDGEKVTLEKYVKDYVAENIEEQINDNPLSNLTNIFNPLVDSITDFAVDQALSSDFVNETVKNEVHSIFDYFLYSDVKEAKQRIKDGITLEENYKLDPNNAPTFEEKVSAEVKMAVFKYIEEESGVSTDYIIMLMSEETITTLKILSAVFLILLAGVSIVEFPSIFVYIKFVLLGYSLTLQYIAKDFTEYFKGNEDLISHQLLKPIIDSFGLYADRAFTLSLVFTAISTILFIAIFIIKRKKKSVR